VVVWLQPTESLADAGNDLVVEHVIEFPAWLECPALCSQDVHGAGQPLGETRGVRRNGAEAQQRHERFPIHALKIDRELIDGLGAEAEDTAGWR
jgi:hypothetical protein